VSPATCRKAISDSVGGNARVLILRAIHSCRLPFLPIDVLPRIGLEVFFIQSVHKDDIQ
jgi:hypothetical protein